MLDRRVRLRTGHQGRGWSSAGVGGPTRAHEMVPLGGGGGVAEPWEAMPAELFGGREGGGNGRGWSSP